MAYLTVQVSVVINAWYGPFYNDIQAALGGENEVTASTLYGHLLVFCIIVFPYITPDRPSSVADLGSNCDPSALRSAYYVDC